MICLACNGTGGTVVYCGDAWQWAFRPDSCPDCEGTGHIPDPCPACGQHGHAMSAESGPGPLCGHHTEERLKLKQEQRSDKTIPDTIIDDLLSTLRHEAIHAERVQGHTAIRLLRAEYLRHSPDPGVKLCSCCRKAWPCPTIVDGCSAYGVSLCARLV